MRIKVTPKFSLLLFAFSFAFLFITETHAQSVRFVQITDPHLFDPGDQGEKNRAALAACVATLNQRIDDQADFQFVVVTGDIGIENLISHADSSGNRILEDQPTQDRQLEEGARQLASILAPTKIPHWLFVPGNNDLYLEQPDLKYYKRFIEALKDKLPGLHITDLCADDGKQNTLPINGLTLIGFNNASFKNDNDFKRISSNKETQRRYVEQVMEPLKNKDVKALIFYHIPEVDDPYIVLDGDLTTGEKREPYTGPFPDSSWFVDAEILGLWRKNVVNNPKVLGLFAGHLHDWRQETYSGSLSKLHICPPLAIKRQDKTPLQARGFAEVTVGATGRIERNILWFDTAENTFAFKKEPIKKNNELELAAFYERERQWSEAESHYREAAAKAETTSVREAALTGLMRVKNPNYPWVKAALAWTDPAFLAPFVLRPLAVIIFVLIVVIIVIAIRTGYSAMVIHPFEGEETTAKRLDSGFPAVRAKVANLANLLSTSRILDPENVHYAFPFLSPQLDQFFPEQAFDVAGVKIPNLNVLVKWLVRPRIQVNGGSVVHATYTFVYAEIWRREFWFGSHLAVVVTRQIPNGPRNATELENFIYDVYLKGHGTI
jgi:hypothetical protein